MDFKLAVLVFTLFACESKPYRGNGRSHVWRQAQPYHTSYMRKASHFGPPRRFLTPPFNQPIINGILRPEYVDGRIVGGHNARPGQVGYQLRVKATTTGNKQKTCGGALVFGFGIQFGLTAAHCVWDAPPPGPYTTIHPKRVRVTAGEHSLKGISGWEQHQTPVRVVLHEHYDYNSNANTDDIAVLFFKKPFEITSHVSNILLPQYLWAQPDRMEISGWGSITKAKPKDRVVPDILQILQINTIDNKECKRRFESGGNRVTWQMICLLQQGVKIGACVGDSGGPGGAYNHTNGKWYLAGLSSYHKGQCGDGKYPSVYTRVSAYINWIRGKVNEFIILNHKGELK